jgi:hypothetical protein
MMFFGRLILGIVAGCASHDFFIGWFAWIGISMVTDALRDEVKKGRKL